MNLYNTDEYSVDWMAMLFSTITPSAQVRTRSFVIDGTNDPRRSVKGFAPATAMRHRTGFTGATPSNMPN